MAGWRGGGRGGGEGEWQGRGKGTQTVQGHRTYPLAKVRGLNIIEMPSWVFVDGRVCAAVGWARQGGLSSTECCQLLVISEAQRLLTHNGLDQVQPGLQLSSD